jgi:hypothetical protein
MEVTSPSGLFILPPKNEEHDEKLS